VAAVSAVGSGDAFSAGLAVGLARDATVEQALRTAAAAGAANTVCLGAGRFDVAAFTDLLEQIRVVPA
jgi:tagatose 6-phosphate kinase